MTLFLEGDSVGKTNLPLYRLPTVVFFICSFFFFFFFFFNNKDLVVLNT